MAAFSTTNVKAQAITDLQAGIAITAARGYDLSIENLYFIFGVEYEHKGVEDQVFMQAAADWFLAQSWVDRVDIKWLSQRIILYKPDPNA